MTIRMDAAALNAFLETEFPQGATCRVTRADADGVTVRLPVDDLHLRPGGTVSGPAMFALADLAVYTALLSRLGPVALAVTTSASIDFMRKPQAGRDLLAECRLLKLGRVLAVGDVMIHSEGVDAPVARATMTYSIPPKTA